MRVYVCTPRYHDASVVAMSVTERVSHYPKSPVGAHSH
jgi:hypothetical protein